MTDLTFRFAEKKDIPLILRFIKELADYEGLLSEVVATEEILETWIFDKEKAENSHTGNFRLFFFYFKRISRTRKNANDPKVTSRNNGKNCGGRFPPKAD